jgi:hypothetical protein
VLPHQSSIFNRLFLTALVFVLLPLQAHAAVIFDTITALDYADLSQLGRLNRNGVPSDWSAPKPFPGTINTTTTYQYQTFNVNVGDFSYIQIIMDDPAANVFASAYLGSYNPGAGLDVNYLGDAGQSGNHLGVDPLVFQVVVPPHSDLVAVVNTTSALGIGETFRLTVEGFYDSEYSDVPGVPEPSTFLLFGAGVAALVWKLRGRRAK